jgi:hypothetical protein
MARVRRPATSATTRSSSVRSIPLSSATGAWPESRPRLVRAGVSLDAVVFDLDGLLLDSETKQANGEG